MESPLHALLEQKRDPPARKERAAASKAAIKLRLQSGDDILLSPPNEANV